MNKPNLQSSFELKGQWFLPNQKEHKIFGTLIFNPQDNIRLDLLGDLDTKILKRNEDIEIILGITDNGKSITLYNCSEINHSHTINDNGSIHTFSYMVLYLFQGIHIEKKEDLRFNSIAGEIYGFSEWINISGLTNINTSRDLHNIEIEYELPNNIEFGIDEKCDGCFKFVSFMSHSKQSVSISQTVQIRFLLKESMFFFDLFDYLHIFQDFLTLAFYEGINIKSVKLYSDKYSTVIDGETVLTEIEVYYRPYSIHIEKSLHSALMLFSYKTIKERFPIIIKEWYKKYALLDFAFDLLFEQFHKGKGFSINNFLNLAQAAESFHSRLYNHTKIPKKEFDEMKKEIMDLSPSKYHTWLRDQFNFGNNLNLHDRLVELIDKYSNSVINKMIPDRDLFIKQIKDSRNYYTHYSKSLEKKALKGSELYKLSQKLKILLTCAFLMECGFESEELEVALDKVKHNFFHYLADWR